MPATDVTIEHYQRQAVKEVILRYCQNEHGARALNSDEHWYKGTDDINHTVALRGPADYEDTIKRGRTLYATLDILEQAVFEQDSKWDEKAGRPETPLGTLAECLAFTLSTDIDGIGDIRSLAVKQAVEAAAQFHVDYLRERGIEKNVYCLYSGGGIYVHLHHGLFAVDVGNTDLTPEARKEQFQILCKAYNQIIGEISQAFFREHPEHIGKVKFDQLNNQKRTFKTIFSIHKRLPFAVIPLDPTAIKISFEKASLPLSDEVLQEGAQWYQSFDPSERKALGTLLKGKIEAVRAVTRDRPEGSTDREISRPEEPLDLANFAPCMKNIIEKAEDREGRHRALAVLATYLYQMGWQEDKAFDLWLEVADRCGVESRIFETTFGLLSCPLCSTMLQDTGGYPHLNLHGMGFCAPDEHCKGCQWPGDYHLQVILNENFDEPKIEEQSKLVPLRYEDVCDIKFDKDGDPQELNLSPTKAAKAVCEKLCLAMTEGSKDIYQWDGQIYRPNGARIIDDTINRLVGDDNDIRHLNEILRRVSNQLLANPVKFEPDPYLFGVKNGVVDLRTGEFRDYRAEDLLLEQADVIYDPNARCPGFLAFLESITPDPTDRLMLIDWFAATAIKEPLAYVLFLLGLGRNGKGVYEDLIMRFFGPAAFREMPLHAIEKSDFAASEFYRKRGWIASETGKRKNVIGTDFLKLTSGNGVIDANVKGKSRIQFRPYFQTMVDTNTMPQIDDNSLGWKERFCKANLPYIFLPNPDSNNPLEKQRDPHLYEKLSTAGELSGILNLVIFRAKEIAKTKTIIKRSGEEMFNEYADQSTSVGTFLELFCEYVEDAGFWTPPGPIYDDYKEWCCYKVGEVVDPRYFGKLLKEFCGGTACKIGKDADRKSIRLYKGLNFDSWKCKGALEALKLSMSTSGLRKSTSSLQGDSSTDSDVYMSTSNTWIDIYRMFGPIKKEILYNKENRENHVEHVDNVDIDSSGGLPPTTHCRRDEDNVDKPQFCAKCGEDLTGHGTRTIGDVVYCLKPGCGMPEREEAGA
jgi:P4 family phage/plasmid primase-like protien